MPETNISRPSEIRRELDTLAPYPADDAVVTARGLACYMAMESQLAWARMTGMDHPITMTDIAILQGYFAAAHALLKFAEVDEVAADECAATVRGAFGDGGSVGEFLWEHHGGHAKAIAALADELAWVTAPPATPAGVTVDPEDLRILMRLADDYAARDPLHLPPNDSCREALARLAAAVKP